MTASWQGGRTGWQAGRQGRRLAGSTAGRPEGWAGGRRSNCLIAEFIDYLEGLFIASRALGLRKVKREERVSHPNRPHGKEGRLWVSKKGAKEAIGASTKEEILQLIGGQWRQMQKDQRNNEKEAQKRGPRVGDKRARTQRKGSNKARAAQARSQRSQKRKRK